MHENHVNITAAPCIERLTRAAAASEGRVGSPCPPHLVPAGSRRRRLSGQTTRLSEIAQAGSPRTGQGIPEPAERSRVDPAGSPQPTSTLQFAGAAGLDPLMQKPGGDHREVGFVAHARPAAPALMAVL
jgi:hypothetical protein